MTDSYYKHPRIYCDQDLSKDALISLTSGQAHYFCNVMRRNDGDMVRIFNENDGEWIGTLQNLSKKSGNVALDDQIRSKEEKKLRIHLFFSPLPKNRMDWMIEKATELGVYAFHPVLTQNTEVRKIKKDRIYAQIIEAAEQCERLSIPTLHDIKPFETAIEVWARAHKENSAFLACLEREDAKPISSFKQPSGDIAILIGPAGGFTEEEKQALSGNPSITLTLLGETILRAETAALSALSVLQL